MIKKYGLFVIPALIIAAVAAFILFFIRVDVTEQAVITRLGKPVRTHTEPGVYTRLPFVEEVRFFSNKLLVYDSNPSEIITNDKKALVIDNYVRWRIGDSLKFYLSVRDEIGGIARIDDIVYSEMRIELGKHTLIEVVAENRNEIMTNVTKEARIKAQEYGIYIDDVRIKRAELPEENEKSVYARMASERERIAKQYRSEGREEAQKIRARTEKDKAIILAEAYREVQEIKGRTDAEVITRYANAHGKDPAFFEFIRSLEVFRNTLDSETNFFLTTEGKLLNTLKTGE